MVDQEKPKTELPTPVPEVFKLYIDIYKHHFDLWLKGYVFYLAVIGSAAGFVFGKDTTQDARAFLMLFVITVSAISLVIWIVGLRWVKDFSAAVDRVAPAHSPPLALKPFRAAVILGFLGSVVILGGALVLYYRGG